MTINTIKSPVFLAVVIFLSSLLGCASKPLTEEQKFERMKGGFRYNTYRKLSKSALGASVDVYNIAQARKGEPPASKEYIHALAGFIWSMALMPKFAVAETEMAINSSNHNARYIALATQSIAFYQEGWGRLGEQRSEQAKQILDSDVTSRKYEQEQKIAHLVLGSVALYKGDSVLAQNSFTKLGDDIGKPWLADVARAASLVMAGSYSESYRLLTGLRNNDKLSESERVHIDKLKARIKSLSDSGKKSDLKLSQLFTRFVYETVKASSDDDEKALAESIEKFQESVDI